MKSNENKTLKPGRCNIKFSLHELYADIQVAIFRLRIVEGLVSMVGHKIHEESEQNFDQLNTSESQSTPV